MARSLAFPHAATGSTDAWASDEGWPYEDVDADDGELDIADPDADLDVDLVSLHTTGAHLLDGLTSLERQVLTGRFGLDGGEPRSMRELQHDLGCGRADLRLALGDALAKVRRHLESA